MKGTTEELKGHAKRAAGKVLDDDELRREGEAQADKGREERRAEVHKAKAESAEARERINQEMK
jgi:uncharacterized protein YjbJ (UPF0337 family)